VLLPAIIGQALLAAGLGTVDRRARHGPGAGDVPAEPGDVPAHPHRRGHRHAARSGEGAFWGFAAAYAVGVPLWAYLVRREVRALVARAADPDPESQPEPDRRAGPVEPVDPFFADLGTMAMPTMQLMAVRPPAPAGAACGAARRPAGARAPAARPARPAPGPGARGARPRRDPGDAPARGHPGRRRRHPGPAGVPAARRTRPTSRRRPAAARGAGWTRARPSGPPGSPVVRAGYPAPPAGAASAGSERHAGPSRLRRASPRGPGRPPAPAPARPGWVRPGPHPGSPNGRPGWPGPGQPGRPPHGPGPGGAPGPGAPGPGALGRHRPGAACSRSAGPGCGPTGAGTRGARTSGARSGAAARRGARSGVRRTVAVPRPRPAGAAADPDGPPAVGETVRASVPTPQKDELDRDPPTGRT
jgi:hypothetical protein